MLQLTVGHGFAWLPGVTIKLETFVAIAVVVMVEPTITERTKLLPLFEYEIVTVDPPY